MKRQRQLEYGREYRAFLKALALCVTAAAWGYPDVPACFDCGFMLAGSPAEFGRRRLEGDHRWYPEGYVEKGASSNTHKAMIENPFQFRILCSNHHLERTITKIKDANIVNPLLHNEVRAQFVYDMDKERKQMQKIEIAPLDEQLRILLNDSQIQSLIPFWQKSLDKQRAIDDRGIFANLTWDTWVLRQYRQWLKVAERHGRNPGSLRNFVLGCDPYKYIHWVVNHSKSSEDYVDGIGNDDPRLKDRFYY